jgi:hypothetical protein
MGHPQNLIQALIKLTCIKILIQHEQAGDFCHFTNIKNMFPGVTCPNLLVSGRLCGPKSDYFFSCASWLGGA